MGGSSNARQIAKQRLLRTAAAAPPYLPPATLARSPAPQALKLTKEPLANVVRYDALRTARKAQAAAGNALAQRGACHAS